MNKFRQLLLIAGAVAAMALLDGGAAQATTPPAHVTAGPAATFWLGWYHKGPYSTLMSCDNEWASFSSQPGVNARYCESHTDGYYIFYQVWY